MQLWYTEGNSNTGFLALYFSLGPKKSLQYNCLCATPWVKVIQSGRHTYTDTAWLQVVVLSTKIPQKTWKHDEIWWWNLHICTCALACANAHYHLHEKSADSPAKSSNWYPCQISFSISMYNQPRPYSNKEQVNNQFLSQMIISM